MKNKIKDIFMRLKKYIKRGLTVYGLSNCKSVTTLDCFNNTKRVANAVIHNLESEM